MFGSIAKNKMLHGIEHGQQWWLISYAIILGAGVMGRKSVSNDVKEAENSVKKSSGLSFAVTIRAVSCPGSRDQNVSCDLESIPSRRSLRRSHCGEARRGEARRGVLLIACCPCVLNTVRGSTHLSPFLAKAPASCCDLNPDCRLTRVTLRCAGI